MHLEALINQTQISYNQISLQIHKSLARPKHALHAPSILFVHGLIVIGASEASPFLVMNVEILSVCLSVCLCVCLSWTGTIFLFCARDPLPTFT